MRPALWACAWALMAASQRPQIAPADKEAMLAAQTFDSSVGGACFTPSPLHEVLAQPLMGRVAIARAQASAHDVQGITTLYLLAHDPSLEVRMEALQSALARCAHESAGTCLGMLRFFNESRESPGAWAARDALLSGQHDDALGQTLVDNKLELIARLATHIGQPSAPAASRAALRLLAEDEDVWVQEAASAWLMTLER